MKEADIKNREMIFIEWLSENKPEYKYVSGFIDKRHEVILYCTLHDIEFSIKVDDLKQNKSNCPECISIVKEKQIEEYRLIRENKFIEWLKDNHPEYEYIRGFVKGDVEVILYCKIHEKEFSAIPDYLKQKTISCPDCSLLHKQVRDEQSRLSKEQEFIDWLASNRPDYEYKCGYIGEKNEVILFCKKHNILFNILVSDLKYNSKICPVCKKEINL